MAPKGRLVAMHSFYAPWDVWEMHPQGSDPIDFYQRCGTFSMREMS